MTPPPLKSSIRNLSTPVYSSGSRGLWIVALVLGLGLIFTSQAHAACGYYVTVGNPGESLMAAADGMNHTLSASSGQSHHSSEGPGCHAGDSGPATTAVPPSSSSDEQSVGLCSSMIAPPIVISAALKSPDGTHQPEVYLPLLDPPPRSSSFN